MFFTSMAETHVMINTYENKKATQYKNISKDKNQIVEILTAPKKLCPLTIYLAKGVHFFSFFHLY